MGYFKVEKMEGKVTLIEYHEMVKTLERTINGLKKDNGALVAKLCKNSIRQKNIEMSIKPISWSESRGGATAYTIIGEIEVFKSKDGYSVSHSKFGNNDRIKFKREQLTIESAKEEVFRQYREILMRAF